MALARQLRRQHDHEVPSHGGGGADVQGLAPPPEAEWSPESALEAQVGLGNAGVAGRMGRQEEPPEPVGGGDYGLGGGLGGGFGLGALMLAGFEEEEGEGALSAGGGRAGLGDAVAPGGEPTQRAPQRVPAQSGAPNSSQRAMSPNAALEQADALAASAVSATSQMPTTSAPGTSRALEAPAPAVSSTPEASASAATRAPSASAPATAAASEGPAPSEGAAAHALASEASAAPGLGPAAQALASEASAAPGLDPAAPRLRPEGASATGDVAFTPTAAFDAWTQLNVKAPAQLAAQRDAVSSALPTLPAPSGLAPGHAPPERPALPGVGLEPLERAPEAAAPEVALAPELATPEQPATQLSPGEDLPTQAAVAIAEVPTITSSPQAPSAPTLAPDPQQLAIPSAQAAAQLHEGATLAAEASAADFGEGGLGPAPAEGELSAEGLQPALALSLPQAADPGLPPELLPHLSALQPQLDARVQPALAEAAFAEASMLPESQALQAAALAEAHGLTQAAASEQLALKDGAASEVSAAREGWRSELDQVSADASDQAYAAQSQQLSAMQAEAQAANAEAQGHLAEAQAQVDAEVAQAGAEAEAEKAQLSEDPSLLDMAAGAARSLVDGLKAAVDAIYSTLRAVVKGIFDLAIAAAQGAITLGQKALALLVETYATLLQGILRLALFAFPEVAERWCAAIERAVALAQQAIEAVAEGLRGAVEWVLGGLASALDTLLSLGQRAWAGALTLVGLFVSGEWQELAVGLRNLADAATQAPPQFEIAAYEELLGGDLDQPLSPGELAAAGLAPSASSSSAQEELPGPPWTPDNVGVDQVMPALELSPELIAEVQAQLGGPNGELRDGEVEFGFSSEGDRNMSAILGLDAASQESAQAEERAWDDGLDPMQRAQARWGLMKGGLSAWWSANWPKLLAGGVLGAIGFVGLNVLTGGAVMAALPPLMAAFGGVMGAVGASYIAGHLGDYLEKGWAGDAKGGGKSLAKAGAAGAVELAMLATMKVGGAALKGAKAAAGGAMRGAKGAAIGATRALKGAAGLAREGAEYSLKQGKVLLKGIGDSAVGKGAKRLGELGERLLERTRFRGFKLALKGMRLRLYGRINPWVKLVDGKLTEVEEGTDGAKWLSEPEFEMLRHHELDAIPERVVEPGGRPDLLGAYKRTELVPERYLQDMERFEALAADPDHGGRIKADSRHEAISGLEAEAQGLIPGPITRGTKGIEFFDGDGMPWDVKTPPSSRPGDKWHLDTERAVAAVVDELRKSPVMSPHTGKPEARRVILDSSLLSQRDHTTIWEKLAMELKPEEVLRVIEINCQL